MKGSLRIVVFFGTLSTLAAMCYRDYIKTDTSDKFRGPQHYCQIPHGVKMEVGTDQKTDDCFYCRCRQYGLFCCGYGYKTGVIQMPTTPGCKWVPGGDPDGCGLIQVKDCPARHCDYKDCYFDCNTGDRIVPAHKRRHTK